LLEASQFIHIVEKRQGLKIAAPRKSRSGQGFIDAEQLLRLAEPMKIRLRAISDRQARLPQ